MGQAAFDINAIKKARFDQVWDMVKSLKGTIYPEESKIRLEQKIQDGKGQYIFNLKDNMNVDNVETCALDRNDVMVPNSIGVFIGLRNTTTKEEVLFPYVPIADGTTPSVHKAGFTNPSLKKMYDGFLAWNMDTSVLLSRYPMEKFLHIPQVQGAFVLNSSDTAVNEGIQSEWGLDQYMSLLMPRYTIAGTRDHKITINFNAATLTFPVTAGYEANIVLMLDGFLIKGGCEYFDGKNSFGDAVGQW